MKVYAAPGTSGDVLDETAARLVILGPEHPCTGNAADSPAREAASAMLSQRGNSPRTFKNSLVFLALDKSRLVELEQAVRQFLAWQSIEWEREQHNLDVFQTNQVTTKRAQADETIGQRIPETYCWLQLPLAQLGPVAGAGPVRLTSARRPEVASAGA